MPGGRACQVGHDSRACAPSRAGGSRMRVCRSPAHPRSCRGGACPGQAPPSSLGRHGASHCKCRLGAKGTSGKHTGSCRREGPRHTASCRPCAKHLRVCAPRCGLSRAVATWSLSPALSAGPQADVSGNSRWWHCTVSKNKFTGSYAVWRLSWRPQSQASCSLRFWVTRGPFPGGSGCHWGRWGGDRLRGGPLFPPGQVCGARGGTLGTGL